MKKKKLNLTNIVLIFCLVAGLALLLYPSVSERWNSMYQTRAISSYTESVANLDNDSYAELIKQAEEYNSSLLENKNSSVLTKAQAAQYNELLDISQTGIMAYIEIPSINCKLPIYHGTTESVLQAGVGHLEWTSLPVGGESTHCVLSGHRGLPSATLFSNLDRLTVGDIFVIQTLGRELTYEVDQILVVEPEELDALEIVEGEDLCTLVTCTPYGINTHRLLVRGHRVDNVSNVHVSSEAVIIEPIIVAPIIAIPLLLLSFIPLIFGRKRKSGAKKTDVEDKTDEKQ